MPLRLLLLLALPACRASSSAADTSGPTDDTASADGAYDLSIAPRFQWEENYGYCGQTSLISAGLYYGQYGSQYDARDDASGGADQSRASSQLLLGVNDTRAAAAVRLELTSWQGSGVEDFLAWVKANVLEGFPVIIGVYTNEARFYGETAPTAGDAEYDHIVPVVAIHSTHPASDASYFADDTLTFSDNGLLGDDTPEGSDYLQTFGFGAFPMTRKEANQPDAPYYALPNGVANYGIAITGVRDDGGDTLPVAVDTSVNFERPEIVDGWSDRPASSAVDLTVTVSDLEAGRDYVLYRYASASSIPTGQFNAHASDATESWPIRVDAGTTWSTTETVQSSEVAAYRAVRADAD